MIDVSEIKGVKGLYAFKALQTLLFSYFMLPEFRQPKETYTEFLKRFSAMEEKEQRETLKRLSILRGLTKTKYWPCACSQKTQTVSPTENQILQILKLKSFCNYY